MGLVDYSDSESETENVAVPVPAKPTPTSDTKNISSSSGSSNKKPFQKVVDRSNPGKIRVNLPGLATRGDANNSTNTEEPPAKRARTSQGGGAFAGFNSFLPPPKNVGKPATTSRSSGKAGGSAPPPGVNLRTGATPGFSSDAGNIVDGNDEKSTARVEQHQQPSIPEGMKPAEEVKLVGKPLMFKPLSVTRRPAKKNTTRSTITTPKTPSGTLPAAATAANTTQAEQAEANVQPPPKKKISLFSIPQESAPGPEPEDKSHGAYEPLDGIDTDDAFAADLPDAYDTSYNPYATQSQPYQEPTAAAASSSYGAPSNSLESIATDMNLSAAARRELFGRRGAPSADMASAKVINFDTEKEYAHNEILRASGEQQTHNPVRAVAPGKHTLRQLVSQVQNQREALEESFAKGKAKQHEAGSRYGWR
ncbi:hypothetical protein F5Y17DRAFT_423816 [Xylariaceae sp. FL0594]|nr:hypothetical protein F5Y17DRAFT_423816 [Xylariaceae sp. FL0594]